MECLKTAVSNPFASPVHFFPRGMRGTSLERRRLEVIPVFATIFIVVATLFRTQRNQHHWSRRSQDPSLARSRIRFP